MKWNEIDERLRKLYNAVATAYNEGVSYHTAQKAEQEAFEIMEELTKQLQDK